MKICKHCNARMHTFSVICMSCGGGVLAITKLSVVTGI